MTCFRRDGGM
jgi:hypothetical protein